jgi:hypothetical protein
MGYQLKSYYMVRGTATVRVTCIVLGLTVCAPIWAQWTYPTANVPKDADDAPNLQGPVPRTREGRPDFSGIWQNARRSDSATGASEDSVTAASDAPPLARFSDVGANMKDGLPIQPWAQELKNQRMAENSKDNPDAHCLPLGYMQFHLHPQPRKIIQTPEVIVILYESNYGVRQIFVDGRPMPDNALPWWYGYSIGRWDGDTLVVESKHFKDGGWLDVNGSPLTDRATITERFTRLDYGNMRIDVTIDDPKAYTAPFTVRVNHQIMLDTDLMEFICLENEKSSQYFDP